MRKIGILVACVGFLSMNAHADPVSISCGDRSKLAIEYEINIADRSVKYTSYRGGNIESRQYFQSGGYYGEASLDFSSDKFGYPVKVHGNFSEIYRTTHLSAITIELYMPFGSSRYLLTTFSDGRITSNRTETVKEESHEDFIGLDCSIEGIKWADHQ